MAALFVIFSTFGCREALLAAATYKVRALVQYRLWAGSNLNSMVTLQSNNTAITTGRVFAF